MSASTIRPRSPRPWPTGRSGAAGVDPRTAPHPVETRPRAARRFAAAALLVALGTGGCVRTGDFGRPASPSFWNETLEQGGTLAAHLRGEPASFGLLTDDEQELRDRAWRFLTPAHGRPGLERLLAELAALRLLPPSERDPALYRDALLDEAVRSPASRYRRIGEDALADARLVGPFAIAAARVAAADRARLKAIGRVHDLAPGEVRGAAARVAENRCLVAWVRAETAARLGGYAFALRHLFVEAPQGEAVAAERAVASLAEHRAALDAAGGGPPPGCGAVEAVAVAVVAKG